MSAGILIAPIANLDPTSYTLFIVPALGVALVGRFESFWIVALAGIALGMLQSEIIKFQTFSWFPTGDVADALPFILIIVAMAVRARSLLARGETVSRAQSHAWPGRGTRSPARPSAWSPARSSCSCCRVRCATPSSPR